MCAGGVDTFAGDMADGGEGDDSIIVQIHSNFGSNSPATIAGGPGYDTVVLETDTTAIIDASDSFESITLAGNTKLMLANGGSVVLRSRSLVLSPTAQLDLANNALILDYSGPSPIDDIRQALASGYAAGAWDGRGIASSVAAANPRSGVGFADATELFNSFPAVFAGHEIDDSTMLLRYTINGDADLDGVVNMADFARLAANFNAPRERWSAGDFDFNGVTGFNDFAHLASNFQVSRSRLAVLNPELDFDDISISIERPIAIFSSAGAFAPVSLDGLRKPATVSILWSWGAGRADDPSLPAGRGAGDDDQREQYLY